MDCGQRQLVLAALGTLALFTASVRVSAQDAADAQNGMPMNQGMNAGWMLMQDGIVFVNVNQQGGPRGGDDVIAPNWWMGMASRETSRGRLTLNAMLSLDPAIVGQDGYLELFQTGEALNGQPIINRQHPHNLFMQLAAVWRMPVTDTTGVTLAGGPVGEAALGPVAYITARRRLTIRRPPSVITPSIPPISHSVS